MADKTLYTRIKNLVKSASDWTTSNPTLLQGEVGFESDTGKSKLGDGVTAWNSLGYIKVTTVDNLTSTSTTEPLSANQGKLLKGLIDDRTPIATSVTIATADWSNYSCTKTVTGMTSDKAVIVTPSPTSMDNYVDASIKCTAQGTNSLTFTCSTVPSASITINILMMEVLPPLLTNLSVSGDWTNTQYTGESVDATGLTFTASYNNGSTKIVNPTSISPSTWSGTGSQTATFSYTEDGVTVSCTKVASVSEKINYVGGTIFYIDSTADGTYTFKNAQGQTVAAPTVGTDCTGWTYTVSGASKDKFYAYNPNAMFKRDRTGTQADPIVTWTYLDTSNQSYIDGATYTSGLPAGKQEWEYYGYNGRVYETLNSTVTNTAIGTGKVNTSNMLALRNGVYNQGSQIKWKNQTQYSETIWYICDQFNKGTYSLNGSPVLNNTECSDWYIPSKDELQAMKNAIGASTFAQMLYSGSVSSGNVCPWSSSADSSVANAGRWFWRLGSDIGMDYNDRYGGFAYDCLALSRSF